MYISIQICVSIYLCTRAYTQVPLYAQFCTCRYENNELRRNMEGGSSLSSALFAYGSPKNYLWFFLCVSIRSLQ